MTSLFPSVNKPVILASGSARRRQLLHQIGLEFQVQPSNLDESHAARLSPEKMVTTLALQKAQNIAQQYSNAIVIGSDTTVALDNKTFGKPATPDDACATLSQLSGKTHQVYTGFALLDQPSTHHLVHFEKTDVTFRKLDEKEIEAYVETGEAMDKAGAYGIQDQSALFVERIQGCFYNVVGFPLTSFYLMFKKFLELAELPNNESLYK